MTLNINVISIKSWIHLEEILKFISFKQCFSSFYDIKIFFLYPIRCKKWFFSLFLDRLPKTAIQSVSDNSHLALQ